MTQEDFRRLKRGKLLILSIKNTHPVYVSNKYILGPMNKHFDSVDPDEYLFSSGTKQQLFNNKITISTHDSMKFSLTSIFCQSGRKNPSIHSEKKQIKIYNMKLLHCI